MPQTAQKENTIPTPELKKRNTFGKRNTKKTLKEGFIPATITSANLGPIHFSITTKALEKMIKNPSFFSQIFEINISEFSQTKQTNSIKITPKSIDFHPINDHPIHIDFLHIQKETTTLSIPIEITGITNSAGLKKGGKLNIARYHVPLLCNINNIPEKLSINITNFGIGRSIFLSKLPLPKECKIIQDYLILSIIGRGRKEKEEESAATAGAITAQTAATPSPKPETKNNK